MLNVKIKEKKVCAKQKPPSKRSAGGASYRGILRSKNPMGGLCEAQT
jgi:hypothetical protein